MPTTEPTINDALAGVLGQTRHAWRASDIVISENSGMLKDSNEKPDILVVEPTVSPVVIETEFYPGTTVESEAIARLGKKVRINGKRILSSLAVRLPSRLRGMQRERLQRELESASDFDMAVYTGSSPTDYSRWPHHGWIQGSVADLSFLVQSASVPPKIIDEAADRLVSGVSEAAGLLREMSNDHPNAIHAISDELRQEDGDQTRRMAGTILANAFVFQENLAGGPGELGSVRSLEQLRGSSAGLSKSSILAEWRKILEVNYWPIFDIARRILEVIPTEDSKPLIDGLAETADKLLENRLMRSHDLTGAVFQRLIADRKFLAAFYTTPASAALLVGLAITPEETPTGGTWASADDVKALRIADFACGTGTLLSTTYQRVSQLHEFAGGDAEAIHPDMMADALVGCDVLPAAAHLTASMLAGAHPSKKYDQSSILTVAYGRQPDGSVALGSLDLLDPQSKFGVVAITARAAGGMGEAEKQTWEDLPHASFDVVIMNPPFTRATGQEGKKVGVRNPMFAAFSASDEDQKRMSKAIDRLTKGTSYHGNAGEASIFLVLADRKLKPGGRLALITPLNLMSGEAWEASRALLTEHYSDLILVSISGADGADLSFSADTDMAECITVGRKSETGSTRATFVVLDERPQYPLLGATAAEQINRLRAAQSLHRLEDGPVGGTPIKFGSEVIGHMLDAPLPASGGWNLVRIADLSLAQTAYQLVNEMRIWLPTMNRSEAVEVPITTVEAIGEIGPYHADICGNTATGGIRGPFDLYPIRPGSAPTYPVLWSHEADRERTMLFEADCEGISRRGPTPEEEKSVEDKVARVWGSASHCHFNRDFRFNSQSTGMQYTQQKTIGGHAWPAIKLGSDELEKALVLWGNTSLGLLMYWWDSNKQQSGRGRSGILALRTLPILDVTALTSDQLAEAVQLFDDMCGLPLLPVYQIDKDPIRKGLDERFGRNVLKLPEPVLAPGGPLDVLRMKLSREPSIRGQK